MKRTIYLLGALIMALVVVTACAPSETTVTATPSPAPTTVPTELPEPTPEPTDVPRPRPTPWRPTAPEAPCEPSDTRSCSILFVLPEFEYPYWTLSLPGEFEQGGYEVIVASRAITNVIPCPAGTTSMEVDLQLADADVRDYDAVIYTGGRGCQSQWDDEEAHRIARDALEHEVVLAAVGCAPTILAHAGVLEGRQAAMCQLDFEHKQGLDYCEVIEDLGAICINQGLVRDGLVVTARPRSWLFVPGMLEMLATR